MKENAFTQVSDPDSLNQIAQEIDGKLVQERINFWMNRFFKFEPYGGQASFIAVIDLSGIWSLIQSSICFDKKIAHLSNRLYTF